MAEQLWCIDNGDRVDERRYRGPFSTRDGAEIAKLTEGLKGEIRECSRADVEPCLQRIDATWIADFIDEDANECPWDSGTWADWEEQLVELKPGAQAALVEWARKHLTVKAYKCIDTPEDDHE